MRYLEFDNLFDWMSLMEHAQEIHTVETSFCYVAALLNLQNMHVYSRNTKTDFKYIQDLFPESWKYYSL